MNKIKVTDVKVSHTHRAIKPWLLSQISEGIKDHGYNDAYPIVIDKDCTLIEGRHRLEAAKANRIEEVPFIYLPADVTPIRFGLLCNADGQKTAADDVFDLAELCWTLAEVEKWQGQRIADEVGFGDPATVTRFSNIKTKLHSLAWSTARYGLTKNADQGKNEQNTLVNQELTKVNFTERHFRDFLSALPYANGSANRATMRAQVKAIRELMAGDKLTAKVAGEVAQRHAWHTKLAKIMNSDLVKEVGIRDRKGILRNVRQNVYGKTESAEGLKKFADTITSLNQKALDVKLYHDDAFQRIPLFDDDSISLVVTDPPYNTTSHEWDKIGTNEQFVGWMREWLELTKPKLRQNYHLFVFCDPDYSADLEIMLRSNGWPIKSRIIWEYRNLVQGRDVTDKFIENYQVCFHCGNHALNWPPQWNDSRFMVQQHATPQSNFVEGKNHPTAKPLALIKLLVEVGSKPGDTVLDMFAGGGTTGEAAKTVGQRRCILIEKENTYCEAIEARLKIRRQK